MIREKKVLKKILSSLLCFSMVFTQGYFLVPNVRATGDGIVHFEFIPKGTGINAGTYAADNLIRMYVEDSSSTILPFTAGEMTFSPASGVPGSFDFGFFTGPNIEGVSGDPIAMATGRAAPINIGVSDVNGGKLAFVLREPGVAKEMRFLLKDNMSGSTTTSITFAVFSDGSSTSPIPRLAQGTVLQNPFSSLTCSSSNCGTASKHIICDQPVAGSTDTYTCRDAGGSQPTTAAQTLATFALTNRNLSTFPYTAATRSTPIPINFTATFTNPNSAYSVKVKAGSIESAQVPMAASTAITLSYPPSQTVSTENLTAELWLMPSGGAWSKVEPAVSFRITPLGNLVGDELDFDDYRYFYFSQKRGIRPQAVNTVMEYHLDSSTPHVTGEIRFKELATRLLSLIREMFSSSP